ncbi:MAG: diadenylate cyclase CdaA [Cyanobacteria bacterium HKST-UBA06]|nr:diadenylate cyclase CdaA [Cyanobacteria bacterium HKST-UBA06]MCA9842197.1 diadenylate cyclase CdaA [Cyanobacteria bacterium HKST-UBA03]
MDSVLLLPSSFDATMLADFLPLDIGSWLSSTTVAWKFVLQLVIIVAVAALIYAKIHGTYAAKLLQGLAFVMGCYLLADILDLNILHQILGVVLQILIIGFIILFQPELRRLMAFLGQPDLLGKFAFTHSASQSSSDVVSELLEAVRLLSKTKTGALIVLESQSASSSDYLEAGTPMDAKLSAELLLTVFHPNTPLHDGAVIINHNHRLMAAGVLLPLSENPKLSWQYGTRHRAALGLSEVSDSCCIVISEETGRISYTELGAITQIQDTAELKDRLETHYNIILDDTLRGGKGSKRTSLGDLLQPEFIARLFTKQVQADVTKELSGSGGGSSSKENN